MRRLSVFFLILPLFFSGCKMSSASQANITLTVSAISIEKSDDGIILTLETVSKDLADKGEIIEYSGKSITDAVNSADRESAYKLIYSHCYALIIKSDISKSNIEELLALVSDKLLPLSCATVFSENEILNSRQSGLWGYELSNFCNLQKTDCPLFKVLKEYFTSGKITLVKISKEKEGYKWKDKKTIFPL